MTTGLSPALIATVIVAGCGPDARSTLDASDCLPDEAVCTDALDDDCDGVVDCADPECWGNDGCGNPEGSCEVTSLSASLSLPDGDCTAPDPPPTASDAENQAFLTTCSPYEAQLALTGFPVGARLVNTNLLLAVCVTVEHSWLRDLQVEAYCPEGNRVILNRFLGRDCPNPMAACQVFLGEPNHEPCEQDPGCTPVPGVGYEYCWTTIASNPPMVELANQDGSPETLPAGDYRPSDPFTGFANCSLDGNWRIRIVDGWSLDNGFVFEAKLAFDGSLSDDCPIVE